MNEPIALDINGVMKYLPHRYPFLLVDRVLEFVSGKSLRALKNVSYNEPYFTGHFPHRPLMPGVIIMEALAQSAGLLAFLTADVILCWRNATRKGLNAVGPVAPAAASAADACAFSAAVTASSVAMSASDGVPPLAMFSTIGTTCASSGSSVAATWISASSAAGMCVLPMRGTGN